MYGIDENVDYFYLPARYSANNYDFLNNLRNNDNILLAVRSLNNTIITKKGPFNKPDITIDFWHKQEITLKVQGYTIGHGFLCSEIVGISDTQGKKIIILRDEEIVSQDGDGSDTEPETLSMPITYEYNSDQLEKIQITNTTVDNSATIRITRSMEIIGKPRETETITINRKGLSRKKYSPIQQSAPQNFGFSKQAGMGTTGHALSYLQPLIAECATNKDLRMETLWNHAKKLSKSARWFTFRYGFQQSDDIRAMDLLPLHGENNKIKSPKKVLVVQLLIDNIEYFILEFGLQMSKSGKNIKKLRGIAIKNVDDSDFLGLNNNQENSRFMKLISNITANNGVLSPIEINKYKKELTTFNHRIAKSNNWVRTAIDKLSDHL